MKDGYRVEVKYGAITKAYNFMFPDFKGAYIFAMRKTDYPAFVKATIIKVDKTDNVYYNVYIH